jgi:hypothetical protein
MRDNNPKRNALDCRSAFVCAEAFQRVADQFIPTIAGIAESKPSQMSPEMGNLVACATNLAFAIELYLKALLMYFELPVPQLHDLHTLYSKIPSEAKDLIEGTYDSSWRKEWLGRKASITLSKGPPGTPHWDDNSNRPKALSDLLERAKTLFESWRYAFESKTAGPLSHELHEFEYGLLRTAAEAMRVEISLRLKDTEQANQSDRLKN